MPGRGYRDGHGGTGPPLARITGKPRAGEWGGLPVYLPCRPGALLSAAPSGYRRCRYVRAGGSGGKSVGGSAVTNRARVFCEKAEELLPRLPADSFDSIVCDPPYGLADLPPEIVIRALTAWLAGNRMFVPDGKGFMSKNWDKFVPPPGIWDECFRVLKPGGYLLAFAAPRTAGLMDISHPAGRVRGTRLLALGVRPGLPQGQVPVEASARADRHGPEASQEQSAVAGSGRLQGWGRGQDQQCGWRVQPSAGVAL